MRRVVILWGLLLAGSLQANEWMRIVPSATVQLRDASDLSFSAEGMLYIADTGHHRVVAVDTLGLLVAETGGFGTSPGQFQWPRRVVANRGNAIWVLDYGNRRIERFTRQLAYQGTVTIPVPAADVRSQPEAMAISPQGDLYVFDRDGGRLLRFDPLFNVQAELGRERGDRFISNISAMSFVAAQGLFWWARGAEELEHTDALLNPATPLRLWHAPESLALAADDTCLVIGSPGGIVLRCGAGLTPDTLITADELTAHGVRRVTAVALESRDRVYLLDGDANAVHRVRTGPGE